MKKGKVFFGVIMVVFFCCSFAYAFSPSTPLDVKDFSYDKPMVVGNVLVEVVSIKSSNDGYEFTYNFKNIGDKTQKVTVSMEEGSKYFDVNIKIKKGEEKVETFYFEKTIDVPVPTYAVVFHKNTVYKTVLEMPSYLQEPIK